MLNFNNSMKKVKFMDFNKIFRIYISKLNTWYKINELNNIFQLSVISKKTNNYYLSLPLNNQKTRSRKPRYYNIKKQIILYKFLIKKFDLININFSRNFIVFDYINRLWFKQ